MSGSGTKNFLIDHPLNKNRWLRHACIEAPRPDLSYRGGITLNSGMSYGTFAAFCQNPQVFLSNETNFDRIKVQNQSSVYDNI
jgi:hypothetical protein